MINKKDLFLSAILAFLYFAFGKITFLLLNNSSIITLAVFPPEGISLAFAIYFGKKVLPGVFIGQFFLAYLSNLNLIPSLSIAAINTIEAYIGAYLFYKFNLNKNLKTFRDFIILLIIIAFILQPFSSILSNIILFLSHQITKNELLKDIISWWFGNVMGQIVFTPFFLLLFSKTNKTDIYKMFFYGAIYFVYIFTIEIVFNIKNPFLLITFSLSAVILITIKENILFGWFLSVISAFIVSYSIYLQVGCFTGKDQFDNTFNFNFYVLIHIISVLIIGILFEERKKYAKILEKRIKEEIKKNDEKQLMLLQQNRHAQMGEAISMIAHQWKQPLNNLSLLIQTLNSKYHNKKLTDDTFKYFKTNSLNQIEYMSHTINDFKNFFKNDLQLKEFIVNDIVNKSLKMIEPLFESENISINFYEKDKIRYKGYPNNLMQAIINILNNAKDVLNERKVQNKTVDIKIKDFISFISLEIEDNAGGIDKNIIDKIFNPYFSTKNKEGTGLGLYMSKIIVEKQMKGKLKVFNGKKGAIFQIILYK